MNRELSEMMSRVVCDPKGDGRQHMALFYGFFFLKYLIFKLFVCSPHYPIGTFHPLLNVRESAVIESGTTSDEIELCLVSNLLSPYPGVILYGVLFLCVCLFPPLFPMFVHAYD